MTKIRIRRARAGDAAALTRVAHAAKRYWGYPERDIRLWKPDLTLTPEMLSTAAAYCAVRGERVIGFYVLSGVRKTRDLEHMWVDPKAIGTGVGRLLFKHLRRRLRAMTVSRLRIASDPHAEGFYRHMGARRVGTVPSRPKGRRLPLLVLRVEPRTRSAPRRGASPSTKAGSV